MCKSKIKVKKCACNNTTICKQIKWTAMIACLFPPSKLKKCSWPKILHVICIFAHLRLKCKNISIFTLSSLSSALWGETICPLALNTLWRHAGCWDAQKGWLRNLPSAVTAFCHFISCKKKTFCAISAWCCWLDGFYREFSKSRKSKMFLMIIKL